MAVIQNYHEQLQEIENDEVKLSTEVANVYVVCAKAGAGTGDGFGHTSELKPIKYEEAINGLDDIAWKDKMTNKHNRMVENNVFEVVKRANLKPGIKVIDSTWACKEISNGTLRRRLNARGFKQIDDQH